MTQGWQQSRALSPAPVPRHGTGEPRSAAGCAQDGALSKNLVKVTAKLPIDVYNAAMMAGIRLGPHLRALLIQDFERRGLV
jgi:hypothetical protein